jgi:hypothetical protein
MAVLLRDLARVERHLTENQRVRLSELTEEFPDVRLNSVLMSLTRDGKVAIMPVGEEVIIRWE